MAVSEYTGTYLKDAIQIIETLDASQIDAMIDILVTARNTGGRLFFLGVGGGAGNCGHAVNDFRKIACIESYAPTDNVSELTARINDDGWDTAFANWLLTSKVGPKDVLFVFSVGGGNEEKKISVNLVEAVKCGKSAGAKVIGVVGRDGGYTAKVADACVVIPTVNADSVTPQTEAFQAVVWHMMVSHPALRRAEMKWESVR